jgi:hypothetical protein
MHAVQRRGRARAGLLVAAVLGALLGSGVADPAPAAAQETYEFTDSFDGAVDAEPTYGLNDNLAARQRGWQRAVAYDRVPGLWYAAPQPRRWSSQVNNPRQSGTLSFHLSTSAVRLAAPLVPGADKRMAVAVTTDPVTGDRASGAWTSVVLSPDRNASGYVDQADVALAALVRSDGRVQVFHEGRLIAAPTEPAAPDAQGRFRVGVSARAGDRAATVTVGSTTVPVELRAGFPGEAHLFLGAFLNNSEATSTFDDLAVSRVRQEHPVEGPRFFGYFAARLTPSLGDHLTEVRGRSNLNVVNISDSARYAPEVLDGCAPAGCLVQTGNEFFRNCNPAANPPTCELYPNFEDRWLRLAGFVRPHLDKIAGFYLMDEPYHKGASSEMVATAAQTIKRTFPDKKVMLVEAAYKVNAQMVVPPEVDWVGFDWYCQPVTAIEPVLRTLESRTAPSQGLFLFPQAAPLKSCGTKAGYRNDAELAALQWDYLQLAARHPRVIGLMSFGLWVEDTPVARLAATIDAHERIANQIIARQTGGIAGPGNWIGRLPERVAPN